MNILVIMGIFSFVALLLAVGNFIVLSLIKHALCKKVVKTDLWYALAFSIIVIGLMGLLRGIWFDGVRHLYWYLGALNFFSLSAFGYFTFLGISKFFKKKWLYRKYVARFFLLLGVFFTALATVNFYSDIKVEKYSIETNKVTREYNFVQVNDIQYGTITKEYMQKVVDLVKEQNPDFVVFVGDLVDFDFYEETDFAMFSEIKAPIYFERGNHEFYHFPEKILAYLQKIANVKLLTNKKDSFGEIDITGIDYERNQEIYQNTIKSIPINTDRYNILIYHEPRNVEYSANLGYDLLLYGHTHAGQIWPFTLVVDVMYEYADGYFELGNAIVHTSDGAALWGPRMRLGSQNEIVNFTITPKNN